LDEIEERDQFVLGEK